MFALTYLSSLLSFLFFPLHAHWPCACAGAARARRCVERAGTGAAWARASPRASALRGSPEPQCESAAPATSSPPSCSCGLRGRVLPWAPPRRTVSRAPSSAGRVCRRCLPRDLRFVSRSAAVVLLRRRWRWPPRTSRCSGRCRVSSAARTRTGPAHCTLNEQGAAPPNVHLRFLPLSARLLNFDFPLSILSQRSDLLLFRYIHALIHTHR